MDHGMIHDSERWSIAFAQLPLTVICFTEAKCTEGPSCFVAPCDALALMEFPLWQEGESSERGLEISTNWSSWMLWNVVIKEMRFA
jgi:hypothetical protein